MIDWRARGGELHQIELPAFPGVLLPAVFLPDAGALYFPVGQVCDALGVADAKRQRAKVRSDYADSIETLAIPTTGGEQAALCIEWEALAAWLVSIQEGRIGEGQRERLRTFKRQVWRAASDILQGKHPATALPDPSSRRGELAGLLSLALHTENRVGKLERVVYVADEGDASPNGHGELTSRVGHCPHCGGAIRVITGEVVIVSADAE
jgi:hypothetical protein